MCPHGVWSDLFAPVKLQCYRVNKRVSNSVSIGRGQSKIETDPDTQSQGGTVELWEARSGRVCNLLVSALKTQAGRYLYPRPLAQPGRRGPTLLTSVLRPRAADTPALVECGEVLWNVRLKDTEDVQAFVLPLSCRLLLDGV